MKPGVREGVDELVLLVHVVDHGVVMPFGHRVLEVVHVGDGVADDLERQWGSLEAHPCPSHGGPVEGIQVD